MKIDLTGLRDSMVEQWRTEFGPKYFSFLIDKGHLIGVRSVGNKGELENVELRMASKYEITINDCWFRVHALLSV